MTIPKDALDKLLAAVSKEYDAQISALTKVKERLEELVSASSVRVERLQERIQALVMQARDDDGVIINVDIEEAIEHLETEGVQNMEDVSGFLAYLEGDLEAREERRDNLAGVITVTPTDSFYLDRDDDDGEE